MLLVQITLWVAAAWLTFGAIGGIALIGRERKPITPGGAITTLIIAGILVAAMVAAALNL